MKPRLNSPETRRRAFVDECIAKCKTFRDGPWRDVMLAVAAIGPDATIEQINEIRAGVGWGWDASLTSARCNGCERAIDVGVTVGDELDDDSATATLCPDCLRKALAVLEAAP